jgi:hypothetical protein
MLDKGLYIIILQTKSAIVPMFVHVLMLEIVVEEFDKTIKKNIFFTFSRRIKVHFMVKVIRLDVRGSCLCC